MGGRGSSSKRKEKRDKISSKKKSRRKESKKRRRYDSDSSSSDDDSLHLKRSSKSDHKRTKHKKPRRDSSLSDYSESPSSDSDSSSNDDNGYKSRKARRLGISVKDVKKKSRKRSTSSIRDVEATSRQKRKRSSRDDDIRPKKKSSKRKSRKDLSSSDSESCSTCQSGSSGSEANDKHKRNIISSDKEKGGRRGRGSDKGRHKKKDRIPSCTWISSPSPSVGKYDKEFYPVNNSRRLRSVITVVHQEHSEEEDRLEKDPHKEEIVYDQNDYPSPKSIDSNEGGSKMESDNQLNAASSEEVRELGKPTIDEGDHNNEERKINKSVPVAALEGDDLEVILRQKALENFMKFRKRPQTCPKSNMGKMDNVTNVASLSNSTVDTPQNESIEQGSCNAQEMVQGSGLLSQREITKAVKLPDSEPVEKSSQPVLAKLNDAALLQEEDKSASCKTNLVKDCKTNLVKDVSVSNTSSIVEDANACSSKAEQTSAELSTGEQSSDQRNEAKDSSQFEQKTMTVMRGGELVQVSYKVYIPKKAPALARRQFKR